MFSPARRCRRLPMRWTWVIRATSNVCAGCITTRSTVCARTSRLPLHRRRCDGDDSLRVRGARIPARPAQRDRAYMGLTDHLGVSPRRVTPPPSSRPLPGVHPRSHRHLPRDRASGEVQRSRGTGAWAAHRCAASARRGRLRPPRVEDQRELRGGASDPGSEAGCRTPTARGASGTRAARCPPTSHPILNASAPTSANSAKCEIRRLRDRARRQELARSEYAAKVDALRREYPVLALQPSQFILPDTHPDR